MPAVVPDNIIDPVVTCFTVTAYAMLSMSALSRIADMMLTITVAAINTDITHLPALLVYIFGMLSTGFLAYKFLMVSLYRNEFAGGIKKMEEEDDLSKRVVSIRENVDKDGNRVRVMYFMSQEDEMTLNHIKKVDKEVLGRFKKNIFSFFCDGVKASVEKEEAKKEEKGDEEKAEEKAEEPEPTPVVSAKPNPDEISGPAESAPTDPPAPQFGNAPDAVRRNNKRPIEEADME
jgi:hypothetical protein